MNTSTQLESIVCVHCLAWKARDARVVLRAARWLLVHPSVLISCSKQGIKHLQADMQHALCSLQARLPNPAQFNRALDKLQDHPHLRSEVISLLASTDALPEHLLRRLQKSGKGSQVSLGTYDWLRNCVTRHSKPNGSCFA
jgi:hypothetical protein